MSSNNVFKCSCCDYRVLHNQEFFNLFSNCKIKSPYKTYSKALITKLCLHCKLYYCDYGNDDVKKRYIHHLCPTKEYEQSIGNVFKFLPFVDRFNMENVCSRWKFISVTQGWLDVKKISTSNYQSWNLDNFRGRKPPQIILEKILVRCGKHLTKLKLSGDISSSVMKFVNRCHNLKYLRLDLEFYNPQDFVGTLKYLKNLKKIKVLTKYVNTFDPQNFLSLTADINNIYYSVGLYGDTPSQSWCNNFSSIISKSHQLQSLSLQNIQFDKETFKIITNIPTLKHLGLITCQLHETNKEGIKKLVHLTSLELNGLANIDDSFLQDISENLINLKSISIQQLLSPKIKKRGVNNLIKLNNLRNVRLCSMKHQINNNIFYQFENLNKLECCGNQFLTDEHLIKVLQKYINLEVLNVMGTAVTVATIQLADRATRHRFGNASKLHVYIHQNIIKDFECLNTPANKYLVLQHDVFWQNKTRVFTK